MPKKANKENKTEERYFHVEHWERRCTWVDIKATSDEEAEKKLRFMLENGLISPSYEQAEDGIENCGEIKKQEYEESEQSDKGIEVSEEDLGSMDE